LWGGRAAERPPIDLLPENAQRVIDYANQNAQKE
jgi:hypothetical protein